MILALWSLKSSKWCLRIQLLRHRKHRVCITNINGFMLLKTVLACDTHCDENCGVSDVEADGTYSKHCYLTHWKESAWSIVLEYVKQVHSVQQKSIDLKFSESRTGSDLRYSCHHNSSLFTYPIFANSWRFSVFYSLQSITPRIY